MKIIDQLKKVNLIQFVPAIFVISLVGNSVFGYTAPKSEKLKNNSENQVEAATTQAKKKTKKANAGDIDLSKIKDGTYEGQANGYRGLEVILVLCYRIDSQYSILFGKYWSLIQDVLFCNILIQISHKADAYIHQRKLPCDIYHLQLSVVNLLKQNNKYSSASYRSDYYVENRVCSTLRWMVQWY